MIDSYNLDCSYTSIIDEVITITLHNCYFISKVIKLPLLKPYQKIVMFYKFYSDMVMILSLINDEFTALNVTVY